MSLLLAEHQLFQAWITTNGWRQPPRMTARRLRAMQPPSVSYGSGVLVPHY